MPDKPKFFTESVRQHVRGGYNEDRGAPVVVLAEGTIKGTWYPGLSGISIEMIGAGAIEMTPAEKARRSVGFTTPIATSPGFRPAPKPGAKPGRKP